MRAIDVFLRQFDDAWRHKWESLEPLLAGVTDDEAAWQAPCYRSEPSADPPRGTILWQVDHMTRCKRDYAALLLGLHGVAPRPRLHGPAATFAEAVAQLREAHLVQRDAIASLTEEDLGRTVEGMSAAEFVTSTIRHDIWHAAQIAVARRLWRTRAHPL